MNKYSAFNGLNTAEKAELIEQINAKEKLYEKGRRIFTLTSESDETGILIQGLAYLVSINNYGEENILEYYSPGNIFGSYFSPDTNVNLYAITAKNANSPYSPVGSFWFTGLSPQYANIL